MGCLFCGETVGIFRKLKDPDFCSNEHREGWVQARERVLIERLAESRLSVGRARDRYLARKVRPAAPAADLALAGFFVQAPTGIGGALVPATIGPEWEPDGGIRQPLLPLAGVRRQKLAGLQADLPWPAFNAGLKVFGDSGLKGLACSPAFNYLRSAASVFGAWKPRRMQAQMPIGTIGHVRRPDVISRRAVPSPIPASFAGCRALFPSLMDPVGPVDCSIGCN